MRPVARSLAASCGLRYGTRAMSRLLRLRKPANRKSIAPVVPAQLSLPGCALANSTSSFIELTESDAGTATTRMRFQPRAIGARSFCRYGRFGTTYGWAVNDDT